MMQAETSISGCKCKHAVSSIVISPGLDYLQVATTFFLATRMNEDELDQVVLLQIHLVDLFRLDAIQTVFMEP